MINIPLKEGLSENCNKILSSTRENLMCRFFYSLEPQITQSIEETGSLLQTIKGGGQVSLSQPSQRNNIQADSDNVLRPLMDFLEGR